MSNKMFCDECGALLPDDATFCDRCGAFVGVGPGDDPDMMTEPMPTPSTRPSTRTQIQSQADPVTQTQIRPPTPASQVARESTAARLRDGESRRGRHPGGGVPMPNPQGGSGERNARDDEHGGSSGTMGWVFAIVLFVISAGLVGYILGTSGSKAPEQERATSTTDNTSQAQAEAKPQGIPPVSSETKANDAEGTTDGKPVQGGDATMDDQAISRDTKSSDDKKDNENAGEQNKEPVVERRMRESVSTRMPLRPDGQLRIGLSVPKGGDDISERIEIEQDGKIVYGSRIVAPMETLEWVPAEGVHEGRATARVYGILGDRDYGEPVTVDIEIVKTPDEEDE